MFNAYLILGQAGIIILMLAFITFLLWVAMAEFVDNVEANKQSKQILKEIEDSLNEAERLYDTKLSEAEERIKEKLKK